MKKSRHRFCQGFEPTEQGREEKFPGNRANREKKYVDQTMKYSLSIFK